MKSFYRVLKFMRPYLLFALLAPALMILEVYMDLLQPKLMQRIIDVGLLNHDNAYILRTGISMGLVALAGLVGGVGCTFFSTKAAVGMGTDLRAVMYRRILEFSAADIDRFSTGSLVTRLTNDIIQVQEISMMMLRILVRAPLQVIGSLIMAVVISPGLSLVLVVLIPLLVLSVIIVISRAFPLFAEVQKRLDSLNTVTRENLGGVRVVKAYVQEENENKRFSAANNRMMDTMQKASDTIAAVFPIMILLLNGGIAAVLYFGGHISVSDPAALSTGNLMAYINYLIQLLMALMMVSMILVRFSRAEVSAKRIMDVLDTVPELRDPYSAEKPYRVRGEIRFSNVSFSYAENGNANGGERLALRNVSFTLNPGETTGLIGTTGSGKTTLVNLLTRLYDVRSGSISLDGIDIRNITQKDLRGSIGIVPQQAVLFSGTIRDNISFGKPDADDEVILEAAGIAQISDFIRSSEAGLDTVLSQRAVNLSGGQKQRISIARALLFNPPVLVLDESTSALDAGTAGKLQQALRKKRKDMVTLIIGQRISSVRSADSIIVLDDGVLLDKGTHDELVERCPLYREIVESQEEEVHHG